MSIESQQSYELASDERMRIPQFVTEITEVGGDRLRSATGTILDNLMIKSSDSSERKHSWENYAITMEATIEAIVAEFEGDSSGVYMGLQIQAIVHKALLFQASGDVYRCIEELETAEEYAYNVGMDDCSEMLIKEIKSYDQ